MKRIVPLIHMNGNSKEALERQYKAANIALDEAIYKFNEIEFHPRDYYPLALPTCDEVEPWDKAVEERNQVKAAFKLIQDYLQEIRIGIYNQK